MNAKYIVRVTIDGKGEDKGFDTVEEVQEYVREQMHSHPDAMIEIFEARPKE